METNSYLTQDEFIEKFKLGYSLATRDERIMETYETYCIGIAKLRSDSIKYLRGIGVPGAIRLQYNDSIQRLSETSHRKYLFAKDPTCGICGHLIERLEDATIDHIHPRAKGGENAFYNKQIAHGYCNVRKSDKIGFTMKKDSVPLL